MTLAVSFMIDPDGTLRCGHQDLTATVAVHKRNGTKKCPVELLYQGTSILSTDANVRELRDIQTLAQHANERHKHADWYDLLVEVAKKVLEQDQAPARMPAVRISARELLAKQHAPLTFVVDEILAAGTTLFTGRSKDGKSLAAYDIGVAVASGGTALGRYRVSQGSVWYLALEDGERRAQQRVKMMQQRVGTQLSPEAQERLSFTLWTAPRLGEGLEEAIVEWITTTPDAKLLIIDILEKIRPARKPYGNGYAEDYAPTATLTQLAQERNVAILIIHHANKAQHDDFRDSASGCMSLIGGADNFWSLSRMPMSEEATLNVIGRDILPQELSLEFKDGFWTVLGLKHLVTMSKERKAIVDVMRAMPQQPLTPRMVAAAVGKKPATTTMLLRKMLADGVVIQPTEGRYVLSPSYLATTTCDSTTTDSEDSEESDDSGESSAEECAPSTPVDSIDSVDPVDSVDSVDSGGRRGRHRGGESTGVNAESTGQETTQPVEKQRRSGGRVNESTESMGSTDFDVFGGAALADEPCIHEHVNDAGLCNDCGQPAEDAF
jgi:hypothetical protein